jgi:hypothetical protein
MAMMAFFRYHRPALLAELADQDPVSGVDPQGDPRLVLGERLQGGKVRIGERDDQRQGQKADRGQPGQDSQGKGYKAQPHQGS